LSSWPSREGFALIMQIWQKFDSICPIFSYQTVNAARKTGKKDRNSGT